MACQALGRCRICDRKHKIAVFGGEKAQHFFIEKAKLKLIILNTVCIVCIAKIEKFVDKMDLDRVFIGSVKEDDDLRRGSKSPKQASSYSDSEKEPLRIIDKKMIKTEIFNPEADNNSDSGSLQIDHVQTEEDPMDDEAISNCSNCTSCCNSDATDTHHGDSQAARNSPNRASTKIGQEKLPKTDEPCRKRPRNSPEIRPAKDATNLNSVSVIRSDGSKPIADDCGSSVKKGGRFLRCDFCSKEFIHAGDRNKHRRKHTGEKPYECNQCQRKFAHASNLARHQRVHSGERPFTCTTCGRTFTRRDKLAIHIAAKRCQPKQNESQQTIVETAEITQS